MILIQVVNVKSIYNTKVNQVNIEQFELAQVRIFKKNVTNGGKKNEFSKSSILSHKQCPSALKLALAMSTNMIFIVTITLDAEYPHISQEKRDISPKFAKIADTCEYKNVFGEKCSPYSV